MATFLALVKANAQTSLQAEQNCLQFDVLTDPSKPEEVFLYERYTSRAGFDAHLRSPHFIAFDTAVTPMIANKDVQLWTQVTQ